MRYQTIPCAIAATVLAFALAAPAGALAKKPKKEPVATETIDGLVLVEGAKSAYVKPGADFTPYTKIMLLDCQVAFREDYVRDYNRGRTGSNRLRSSDIERIKEDVAGLFREVFTEVLSEKDGYEIVDEAGDDVLLIRPAIIELDITAPDTRSTGRTRNFTSSSGSATILIELYDSVSGAILARAAEFKESKYRGGNLSYTNSVTNRSDAKRIFKDWAKRLRARLDEYHGE